MPDSFDTSAADGETIAARMFAGDVPNVDVARAYDATLLRARLIRSRRSTAWIGVAAAAAVALAMAFTPLGTYATNLLEIFEPKSFAAIAISPQDSEQLRLAPNLGDFGTFSTPKPDFKSVASLQAAAALAGFEPRRIDYVPSDPRARSRTFVLLPQTYTYTFSAKRAADYERRFQRHLPPMPPGLDGTSVHAIVGPGIAIAYGSDDTDLHHAREAMNENGGLFFMQAKAPQLQSTGASMQTLLSYLLTLPNVPAHVADQLRAIGDPSSTLPVPFALGRSDATAVTVDGVSGLAIGDQTGLGSGIVWQKNGMIYTLAGSLKESDLLKIAQSLHT